MTRRGPFGQKELYAFLNTPSSRLEADIGCINEDRQLDNKPERQRRDMFNRCFGDDPLSIHVSDVTDMVPLDTAPRQTPDASRSSYSGMDSTMSASQVGK